MEQDPLNLAALIQYIYPGIDMVDGCRIYDDGRETHYIGAWNVPGVPQPLEADILARREEFRARFLNDQAVKARRAAYPDVGDQLDALLKQLLVSGQPLDGALADIIDKWKAVKAEHPKVIDAAVGDILEIPAKAIPDVDSKPEVFSDLDVPPATE